MSKTIVFVHGAWVTPTSWDPFRTFFEARGFTTHAPAWPYVAEHLVDEMNNATPSDFGALTLGRIAWKRPRSRRCCPKADAAISKSARPLFHVRFCDLNSDGPISDTSDFGQQRPAPRPAQNSFPHSSAHDHRGSGTEDFLTPRGVRNPQRYETVRF